MELNIHSHFEFKIEVIFKEEDQFPIYCDSWVYVRPWTWSAFKSTNQNEDDYDIVLNFYELE